jgi:hypothetical protein
VLTVCNVQTVVALNFNWTGAFRRNQLRHRYSAQMYEKQTESHHRSRRIRGKGLVGLTRQKLQKWSFLRATMPASGELLLLMGWLVGCGGVHV